MKIRSIVKLGAIGASLLSAAAIASAAEKHFTGKIESVDNQERTVTVSELLGHRTFDMGANCAVTLWDGAHGAIHDLRPGQKVTVGYQKVHGVLAADRIEQEAMRYSGIVQSIDPARRQLVMRHWEHDKSLILAPDCKVMLREKEIGALASIAPGDHVSLVYEAPFGQDVVVQIAQTSMSFEGSVTAIDVPDRTVTLAGTFHSERFRLANDCSIVLNGRIDAPLMDLRPGQRLAINYDEVNGVYVANRIAPAESHEATTAQTYPNP